MRVIVLVTQSAQSEHLVEEGIQKLQDYEMYNADCRGDQPDRQPISPLQVLFRGN